MGEATTEFTTYCPACGQALALSATKLSPYIRCPRCSQKLTTAELVGHSVPVPPVPASAPPLLNTNPEPTASGTSAIAEPIEQAALSPSFAQSFEPLGRVSGFGRKVLAACERLDQLLTGKRVWVLSIAALTSGVVAPVLDSMPGDDSRLLGPFTAVATVVFLFLCWLFAFAFAGSLRNEDGGWQGGLVLVRVRAAFVDLCARFTEFHESTGRQRWLILSWVTLLGGVAVLGASKGLALAFMALSEIGVHSTLGGSAAQLAGFGWPLVVLGGLTWLLSKLGQRSTHAASEAELRVSTDAARRLGAIINLDGRARDFGEVTLVHEVLTALSKWKTRRWSSEKEYQDSLERHLERAIPQLQLEREVKMGATRRDGKADFVVANAIILELKRGFRKKSELDRMVGQMRGYARRWPERPAILVVFEASVDDVLSGPVTPELEQLHAHQPMLTVRMPTPK